MCKKLSGLVLSSNLNVDTVEAVFDGKKIVQNRQTGTVNSSIFCQRFRIKTKIFRQILSGAKVLKPVDSQNLWSFLVKRQRNKMSDSESDFEAGTSSSSTKKRKMKANQKVIFEILCYHFVMNCRQWIHTSKCFISISKD